MKRKSEHAETRRSKPAAAGVGDGARLEKAASFGLETEGRGGGAASSGFETEGRNGGLSPFGSETEARFETAVSFGLEFKERVGGAAPFGSDIKALRYCTTPPVPAFAEPDDCAEDVSFDEPLLLLCGAGDEDGLTLLEPDADGWPAALELSAFLRLGSGFLDDANEEETAGLLCSGLKRNRSKRATMLPPLLSDAASEGSADRVCTLGGSPMRDAAVGDMARRALGGDVSLPSRPLLSAALAPAAALAGRGRVWAASTPFAAT